MENEQRVSLYALIKWALEEDTEREIAAEIAISNVAVHKRIVKMRNELIKAIA